MIGQDGNTQREIWRLVRVMMISVCTHLQCDSLQLRYLPLALEGAELIIWEELERIELRLEEEGLGCKTQHIVNITKTIKALIWKKKSPLSIFYSLSSGQEMIKVYVHHSSSSTGEAGERFILQALYFPANFLKTLEFRISTNSQHIFIVYYIALLDYFPLSCNIISLFIFLKTWIYSSK